MLFSAMSLSKRIPFLSPTSDEKVLLDCASVPLIEALDGSPAFLRWTAFKMDDNFRSSTFTAATDAFFDAADAVGQEKTNCMAIGTQIGLAKRAIAAIVRK